MRNSERATWRRCRLKWHWSYVFFLAPEREKGALTFGTGVHLALAEFYPPGRKRGPHPAKTFAKWYEEQKRQFSQWDEEGNKVDALELGVTMLEGYVDTYGDDDHIEIIAPEYPLQVDIYDEQGKYLITWVGRGDAVYRDLARSTRRSDVIKMLEHKTAKSIEEELRIISGYGEQGHSYWWGTSHVLHANGLLHPEQHIDSVTFNWLKKALPSAKVRNPQGLILNKPTKDALEAECVRLGLDAGRKPTVADYTAVLELAGVDVPQLGEPSKVQPGPLFHRHEIDYGNHRHDTFEKRIRAEAQEIKAARNNKLKIYKNPTKDCSWDCPFRDACELHEMGGDWEDVLELEFVEWNPYSDHELLEERS